MNPYARRDAVAKMRDAQRLHERGQEKKIFKLNRERIPEEVKKRSTEKASVTNRLKRVPVTLPTLPPRRTTE